MERYDVKMDFHHNNSLSRVCPIGTNPYIIKPGDTLWSLAGQFGTTVQALMTSNPGINYTNLVVGQRICIPTTDVPLACPLGTVPYAIQPGDTFWIIAQRVGVSVNDIITLNPQVNPNFLVVGQQICIPYILPKLYQFPCVVTLLATEPNQRAGGSVWIREDEFSVSGFPILFAATFLPEPSTLGDFDAYIGRITIAEPPPGPPIIYSVILDRVERPLQQVTWAGTRIIPERPAVTDTVEVMPYNTTTDVTGSAILRSTLEKCEM